jgi:hypothetical protein
MNTNPVLWLQAYIIGVLAFLFSIAAIPEHPAAATRPSRQ